MSDEIANLIARKFIQRRDVKAIQLPANDKHPTGSYSPIRAPWVRSDINDHLTMRKTYGHYLLDHEDQCKLFILDVDLEKMGFLPTLPMPDDEDQYETWRTSFVPCNPREAWRDRSNPARGYIKYQFRMLAGMLTRSISENLQIPTAAAYSGNKGIHVYGFTGTVSADDAREGALIALDAIGDFVLTRGHHIFKHQDQSVSGYPNFSLEVYPKQGTLKDKDLGNLVRLPLGRNLKSPDPTFFIDLNAPMSELKPVDPIFAMTTRSPWQVTNA